jgi:hypothetical protein
MQASERRTSMATLSKRIRINVAVALLLAGLTTSAHSQVAGGGLSSFGGESRGTVQFAGKVVCVGCSLEDVRQAHPHQHDLYLLRHRQGQVVMEVETVNEQPLWNSLTWPPRLWVRAADQLFAQLTAEQNLFKEVEITGLLRNTRTLDVFDVTVRG